MVDPDISARSMVTAVSAVIAMPSSSPAMLGRTQGIPSIYFDPFGEIDEDESHYVPAIKDTTELRKWASGLTLSSTQVFSSERKTPECSEGV